MEFYELGRNEDYKPNSVENIYKHWVTQKGIVAKIEAEANENKGMIEFYEAKIINNNFKMEAIDIDALYKLLEDKASIESRMTNETTTRDQLESEIKSKFYFGTQQILIRPINQRPILLEIMNNKILSKSV